MSDLSAQPERLTGYLPDGSPSTLDPRAPMPGRVEALLALGIEMDELAETLGVTPTTIRNWLHGDATPRRGPVRTVDDLRRAVVILAEGGVEDADAAHWLRSRQGGALEDGRPLEVIREDPIKVLAAARGFVRALEEEKEPAAALHLVSD